MAPFFLHDSVLGAKAELDLARPVSCYVCGPTVYDRAHLGHARTYVFSDTLRRALEACGADVRTAMNITDVDDKIVASGADAALMEDLFWRDMAALNVARPHVVRRVTESIPDIVTYLETLQGRGCAYVGGDGALYFDSGAAGAPGFFPCGRCAANLEPEASAKEPRDFVLWKPAAGPPRWDSPWGPGRPGWHVECAAIVRSVFGDGVTVHMGGVDLRFPHHENEARLAWAHGERRPWTEAFAHVGHLGIDGLKMSKSLKNFVKVEEVLQGGCTGRQLRLALLKQHYRGPAHFSWEMLKEAKAADGTLSRLCRGAGAQDADADAWRSRLLRDHLANDLDTPGALALILEMARGPAPRDAMRAAARDALLVMGLDYRPTAPDEVVARLAGARDAIRSCAAATGNARLFEISDRLREVLAADFGTATEDVAGATLVLP